MKQWLNVALGWGVLAVASHGALAGTFFAPTDVPTNTAGSTVQFDAQGNIHSVYRVYSRGDAFYASCASQCTGKTQVKAVRFKTDGAVQNIMLALTRKGQPRVLFHTSQNAYYGACDANCTSIKNWKTSVILTRAKFGEAGLDISGEAFVLDAQDRPRFIMSSYPQIIASLQSRFDTYFVSCDVQCTQAGNWNRARLWDDEAWRDVQLKVTPTNELRAAFIGRTKGLSGPNNRDIAAYGECRAACGTPENWNVTGLDNLYVTQRLTSKPTVAMELTSTGAPRIAMIGTYLNDEKGYLRYLSCDQDCVGEKVDASWSALTLTESESLYPGLDLALEGGKPRMVFSTHGNVFMAVCDTGCAQDANRWTPKVVEKGDDLLADKVIPYPNCTLAAWFLYDPSIAVRAGGKVAVSYSASDDSGGFSTPDTTKPECKAGTDMIFARLHLK